MSQRHQRKQGARAASTGTQEPQRIPNGYRVILGVILIYGCVALMVAFVNKNQRGNVFTLPSLFQRAAGLQSITNCVQRDSFCIPLSAYCRNVAEQLPPDARVFMLHMLGPENGPKLGYYFFMTYYLFPREVAISAGQQVTNYGEYYLGREPTNTDELTKAGYNFAFDFNANQISVTPLARLPESPRERIGGVCKTSDALVAGVLPLLVTGFGLWLLQILFAFEGSSMGFGEKFACGLGLGSLFVSQALFGCRLMGLECERAMFWLLLLGGVALMVRHFKSVKAAFTPALRQWSRPASLLVAPHLVLFAALLWLAAVEGLTEYDAVVGWALKAKIIFLFRGHEIVRWFSEPRLASAHLDYPVLVPALHAFTYGVLGGVDEFVTKFWPVWMAMALVAMILSVCGFPVRNRFLAPVIALVVLCMPVTMQYVLAEGATVPAMFFSGLGCIECTLGIAKSDKKRLWLGLLLLLGSALTKFEGMMVLFMWILVVFGWSKTRNLLICGRREYVILALAVGLVIPYGTLRLQIPKLDYDQLALQTMVKHPVKIASHVPKIFSILMARQCVDENLAAWTVSNGGRTAWTGKWLGWQSPVNSYNLGWGWLCIILSIVLIYLRDTRRATVFLVTVVVCFFAFIAAVYCALPYFSNDPQGVIDITGNITGGRQVYPMFLAWGLSLVVLAISTRPSK